MSEGKPTLTVEQAREDILAQFAAMKSTMGFALTAVWIEDYLQDQGEAGIEAYQSACAQLADEGLVSYRAGRGPHQDTVAITRDGIDAIYPEPDPDIIQRDILAKFKETGAREGYTLPEFWLQRDYERGINERQQAIFQDTLRDMASEGLVEYVAHPSPNLKITSLGLERIAEMGL